MKNAPFWCNVPRGKFPDFGRFWPKIGNALVKFSDIMKLYRTLSAGFAMLFINNIGYITFSHLNFFGQAVRIGLTKKIFFRNIGTNVPVFRVKSAAFAICANVIPLTKTEIFDMLYLNSNESNE